MDRIDRGARVVKGAMDHAAGDDAVGRIAGAVATATATTSAAVL